MLNGSGSDVEAASSRKVNVTVSPDTLVKVARGFSCVFWGIPISLLMFFGTLDLGPFDRFRMPAYVLGVFVIYCGVLLFHRAGSLGDAWRRRIRQAVMVLLLEVYLAPFVYWWKQRPDEAYYAANVLALMLVTTWGLFLINRLAGDTGRALHNSSFFIETRLSGWIVLGCMAMPIGYALVASAHSFLEFGDTGILSVPFSQVDFPPWVFAVALLPFTLTMAIAWKAKEHCLEVLKLSAKVPPLDAGGRPLNP